MQKDIDNVKAGLTLFLAAVFEVFFCSFFVTLFWNLTIPIIVTQLNPITYWQGMGLYMLVKFLTYRDSK